VRPPLDSDPSSDAIQIRGAREHNLKDISVDIPRGKFVVVTGVSGSGKSTLAFDLLFAEGQRRFLDSMSAYARQFVEQMPRPDVDLISGLPPTVSIEQTTSRGGGKSTVATVTEVHQFLRLLFARLGTQHCPDCNVPVSAQTRDEIVSTLRSELRQRGPLRLLAPVIRNRKGFHSEIADWAIRQGFKELRADGRLHPADQPFRLDRFKEHDVEVVIAEIPAAAGPRQLAAIRAAVDRGIEVGNGVIFAWDAKNRTTVHSTDRSCPSCRRSFSPLDPKNFSYNSSQGWCPTCRGFGELFKIPDVDRGANADAIEESWWRWADGEREACPDCLGGRLKPEARAVHLPLPSPANLSSDDPSEGGPTIDSFACATVTEAFAWADSIRPVGRTAEIARDILPEIRERLRFLCEVGLGYLQLGRAITTLSGGEAQRIRLAAQLGSNLAGVLYVLDEPTIGLHSRDNDQLLDALVRLRDRGNSLVVVEHDEETMRRADHIIDLGPGAGVKGGQVVASGTLTELQHHPDSITGACLRDRPSHPARGQRRPIDPKASTGWLSLEKVRLHNLEDVSARFPLGRFIVVSGVSGSGKSTLVKDCLVPAVSAAVAGSRPTPGSPRIQGHQSITAVHEVTQAPIGRTPRSTPATYVGFFDDIRKLFSTAPESRMRGYGPGRFSFNSPQGRCPQCEGTGFIAIEMNFLPPAQIRCDTCAGRRFNPETLDVHWNGKSIADILDLSVAEAISFFSAHSRLLRPLEALRDTGLDYLRLGQTSPTLSGGEAQRIKLVSHLLSGLRPGPDAEPAPKTRRGTARHDLFVLEEPTIGLHLQDVRRLVEVLQRLVDAGHTVIVIEHNLDLIAEADWLIDLGPEGGAGGGRIIAEGTPEQVARIKTSHTGRYLSGFLRPNPRWTGAQSNPGTLSSLP
jgi:excinuclease ABC subunit A